MFTQTNDYSFGAGATQYADWNDVTVYRNGTLVWGVEPQ
jgi:endoglucanase